jgi:hypothetical protein
VSYDNPRVFFHSVTPYQSFAFCLLFPGVTCSRGPYSPSLSFSRPPFLAVSCLDAVSFVFHSQHPTPIHRAAPDWPPHPPARTTNAPDLRLILAFLPAPWLSSCLEHTLVHFPRSLLSGPVETAFFSTLESYPRPSSLRVAHSCANQISNWAFSTCGNCRGRSISVKSRVQIDLGLGLNAVKWEQAAGLNGASIVAPACQLQRN